MADASAIAAIGVDVGGTNLKAGLVKPDGHVVERRAVATESGGGVDHVIDRIVRLIEDLRDAAAAAGLAVEAVGLGMPGMLSRSRGVVLAPPNLPGWRDVPVVRRVGDATGLRVLLDNDANYAALGEYLCGAGRGVRHMAALTLGTGIGGGIILDGRLWHGAGGNGGEIGHMIVHVGGRRCSCGQLGCLEAYASASSTAARTVERIKGGESSSLKERLEAGRTVDAEDVVEAAVSGDKLAGEVWEETCRYLAAACISIQHALSLERIVLAGGMSAAGERLVRPVVTLTEEISSSMLGDPPDIRIAELGNEAGFIGSAMAVFQGN